uniref:Mediator complex subunit Med12 LCEWAV-domain domain-containing protein n=1 Tax=Guillardia theta TaxID=55529 RepID=A0A7S4PPY7_GUITH
MTRLRETWIKPAMNSTWQVVFEEHRKARTFVKIVCGWAVSRYREHVPEAVYVAASFLKGLDQNLSEFFKIDIKDNDSQSGTQSNSPDGQNESASSPMQMDTTDENEYSLHAYIEEFLESFEPESGYEEPEMDTLERLIGELIRNRVFDHNMWIFGLIARGAFQKNNSSSPENKFRKHHRLLANIPSYPEARHDSCQRRILLRSIGVMDMGPCSLFYALKIVRFLSWSASDLDQKRLKTTPGTEILESFTNAAAELKAIGRFDPSRINAIEWEESVNFVWLQHERHHDYSDAFTDGILSSRGLSILFSSLYKIMLEVPLYVRVQLCRHIASVIQYIADRTRSVEFELIEPSDIPEDLKLTDEVLYRAITLLECAGDLKCLIALLEWLIENFPSALAAMTMFSHLRTIRALDIASRVFDLSLTALLKTEASNKQNAAMGISELLSAMIRHGSESDLKSFEEKMTAKTTGLKSPLGPKASAVSQLLQDALENKPTKRPDVHANVDDVELKESIKAAEQRPELSDLVGRIFSGGHTIQEVAEQIKKHVAEANISHSVLVAAILRCAVNGTLKEIRSNYRFGCTGFALSSMLSLLAALEHHYGKMHLARIALNIVMDRMYETAVVPAASEDTSPSTVDTPQPQTPLTPATPDSLPNPKSRVGDDADLTLRQDATLAFVGGLLAKGLLIWEDIEKQVKAKLEDVVNGKHPHLARLLLNFVEMLLTDKRKGAAAMMIRIDWQKLRVLRQTQPTLSDVYIMLKYLVQIIDQRDWKQPALTCMQQVVHDPGFCRIILCDDPRSFLKDCCKACMLTLRTAPDVISPFRYFTFLPGNGSRDGPLAAVQDVIARVGRWSLHYDCIELRILVDAWKGGLADLTENMPEPNGWKAMASHPAVDQDKVNNFQSQLSDDKLNELNEAFLRNQDQIIEHHVVEMLLAQLWRSPRNVSRVLDFAKAMGQSFQDRELMGSGGWFEEKMVSIVLAVMSCEPIAKANMGIDSFFRDFIHPSSLNADRGSKIVDDNEHTASFELALVHVIERYGILLPNIQQDRDGASVQLLSLRKDCISKLISLINTLVDQANSGEFRNDYPLEAQGAESASSSQPNVGSLQRALILRLQMLSASLVYLPDEDPQNKSRETLKSVIDCIKFVFSCKTLLGYELGDGVYRTAMLILDRAGSGRDSLLTQRDSRGVVKTMGQWFRSEAQKELLRMKFPRLVASNLSLELPVGGVSLTNGGFVRQAPHDWNYAEETGVFGTGLCSFDQLFELDPWLLLEDFPQGVLSRHLQQVKRRPRKRLRFEFASPEQIAAEKALAEKAAQEKEMAAAAAEEVVEEVGFDVGFVEPGTSMLSGPSNDWPGGWGGGGAVTDSIFTDLDLV